MWQRHFYLSSHIPVQLASSPQILHERKSYSVAKILGVEIFRTTFIVIQV